jgi:hypothetical protein
MSVPVRLAAMRLVPLFEHLKLLASRFKLAMTLQAHRVTSSVPLPTEYHSTFYEPPARFVGWVVKLDVEQ